MEMQERDERRDDLEQTPVTGDRPSQRSSPQRIGRRTFATGAAATVMVGAVAALAVIARRNGVGDVPPTSTATSTPVSGQQPVSSTPTPSSSDRVSAFVATAPRTLRAGGVETVSISLLNGSYPARSKVAVELLKENAVVASGNEWVTGRGSVPLQLPRGTTGDFTLRVSGNGFSEQGPVRVEDGTLLFLETDKPIYKPGQTIRIRLATLDSNLRPVSGEATIECQDAKGLKIFKKPVTLDDYGMATIDLPLSNEPNLGVWKLRAAMGSGANARTTQLDVRVEHYVLPKYQITTTLPKNWALTSEAITGTVAADYSFGKPVKGEVEIIALVYRGVWQQYARVTKPIDGKVAFELPAVGSAVGSPGNAGAGNVRLDVTVREAATGYEEQTSTLLTIVARPISVRLLPESGAFKPTLPLDILVLAETPDKRPAETTVSLKITHFDEKSGPVKTETRQVTTRNGVATLTLTPPEGATVLSVQPGATGQYMGTSLILRAAYSPTGAFLRVAQTSSGALRVGDTATFAIKATKEARGFYYEVLARGRVVFSDWTEKPEIALRLQPYMAPEARLVVYQVLPNSEVAADWLSVKVEGSLPQQVQVTPERAEVKPGDEVALNVQTEGVARVGLVAVDRAVFILAENRLNLRQVFDEIERLYQAPQAEAHPEKPVVDGPAVGPVAPGAPRVAVPVGGADPGINPGAKEIFQNAGLLVLTNRTVPEGKRPTEATRAGGVVRAAPAAAAGATPAAASAAPAKAADQGAPAQEQAEPERTRQFFPETWVWSGLTTDTAGRASQRVTAPDSITTWNLRAVAISKEKGLGIGEGEIRVFQPFFVSVDLPYSVVRGEEFPVKIALYNYGETAQDFTVALDAANWFANLGPTSRTVSVAAKAVGAAEFTIRPNGLGVQQVKVTARGQSLADAIVKEVIVEPEGVAREQVANLLLTAGTPRVIPLAPPPGAIDGSPRALVAVTGNILSQTISGLEGLLKMPYGCGEQNMVLFAPDVYISRYLKETGQNKPEVQAKAEVLMLTGYQRELTYRRSDNSFSAFGNRDSSGSLWLTAFVLKTFAQAKDLIYIDEAVQTASRDWIRKVQRADGSFEQVGFVHHEEMMGGATGKTALTAYVAIALREAGDDATSAKAVRWLEGQLNGLADPYALAISTYALALAKSPRTTAARDQLLALAHESDDGLSWGDGPRPLNAPATPAPPARPRPPVDRGRSAAIETTGYATLALLAAGDTVNAGRAARWLSAQRGAQGGFGSTQDTVIALQALTTIAAKSRADIDATVTISAGAFRKEVPVRPENADVVQVVELPAGTDEVTVETRGKGQPYTQVVNRYNLPNAEAAADSIFKFDVRYGAEQVAANDLLTVTATVRYTPPEPVAAGMVVLDIAVPTGFAPEESSITAAAKRQPKVMRWDIAGRKVIFYINDMAPNESLTLEFQARALYPVRAQAVASQAYRYYRPEWRGESLGGKVIVA